MAESLSAWAREFAASHAGLRVQRHVLPRAVGALATSARRSTRARGCSRPTCRWAATTRATRCSSPCGGCWPRPGVPVVVHCGSGPLPGAHTGPGPFGEVLAAHPRLTAVIAHCGAPEYAAHLALAERYRNVHLDTTMVGTRSSTHLAPSPPRMRALGDLGDRVVLGSDFPNIPYAYAEQLDALHASSWRRLAARGLLGQRRAAARPGCPEWPVPRLGTTSVGWPRGGAGRRRTRWSPARDERARCRRWRVHSPRWEREPAKVPRAALARFSDGPLTDPARSAAGWSARGAARRMTPSPTATSASPRIRRSENGDAWCTLSVTLPGRRAAWSSTTGRRSGRPGVPADAGAPVAPATRAFDAPYAVGGARSRPSARVLPPAVRRPAARAAGAAAGAARRSAAAHVRRRRRDAEDRAGWRGRAVPGLHTVLRDPRSGRDAGFTGGAGRGCSRRRPAGYGA